MENIFENAKFGDKFRTRDGRMAVYMRCKPSGKHEVMLDKAYDVYHYKDNGYLCGFTNHTNCDILSNWYDPINEEELDSLAEESYNESGCGDCDNSLDPYIDGFKVGIRNGIEHAKEDIMCKLNQILKLQVIYKAMPQNTADNIIESMKELL